jgi:hypothetical protein
MLHLINATVHIDCVSVRWKSCIEVCFSNVGAKSIDSFQSCSGIDAEGIGSDANKLSIFLMCAMEGKMSTSTIRVISKVDVSYACQGRPRIASERM